MSVLRRGGEGGLSGGLNQSAVRSGGVQRQGGGRKLQVADGMIAEV